MLQPDQRIKDDTQMIPLVIHANYELFCLGVVLLSLFNFPLSLLLPSPEQRTVIAIVEFEITTYLLADAIYRLLRAPSRSHFLWRDYGWLVLLGSLPHPLLRLARLLYMFLGYRRLRRPDYGQMGQIIVERRAQSTLLFVLLSAIIVLEVGSVLILGAESNQPRANIKTASDALWWIVVTIGTIGYGDLYPVTNAGRVIGAVVIITGVTLFSALTSFLAQWFLAPRGKTLADTPPKE